MAILGLYLLPAAAGILLLYYGIHLIFLGVLLEIFSGGFDTVIFSTVRLLGLIVGMILLPFEALPGLMLAIAGSAAMLIITLIFHASWIDTRRTNQFA
jgi:hypothetical protein